MPRGSELRARILTHIDRALVRGEGGAASWGNLVVWDGDAPTTSTSGGSSSSSSTIAASIRAFAVPASPAGNAPTHVTAANAAAVATVIANRARLLSRHAWPTPDTFDPALQTLCRVVTSLTATGHFGTRVFAQALLATDAAVSASADRGATNRSAPALPAEVLVALHDADALNVAGFITELNEAGAPNAANLRKALGKALGARLADLWDCHAKTAAASAPDGDPASRQQPYPGESLLVLLGNLAMQETGVHGAAGWAVQAFLRRLEQRCAFRSVARAILTLQRTTVWSDQTALHIPSTEVLLAGLVTPRRCLDGTEDEDADADVRAHAGAVVAALANIGSAEAIDYATAIRAAVAAAGIKAAITVLEKLVANRFQHQRDREDAKTTIPLYIAAALTSSAADAESAPALLDTAVANTTAAAMQSTDAVGLPSALAFAHAVHTSQHRRKSSFKRWLFATFVPNRELGNVLPPGAAKAAAATAATAATNMGGAAAHMVPAPSAAAAAEAARRDLAILLRALEQSVPSNKPQILKVYVEVMAGILHPSLASFLTPPLKGKLQDYLLLAKTRLADFGITVAGSGGNGSGAAGMLSKSKASDDARKIIAKYAQTGQIPDMLNQCSIFQAKYFKKELIPALLTKIDLAQQHDSVYASKGGGSKNVSSSAEETARRENAMLEQARGNLVVVLVKKKKVSAEEVAAADAAASAAASERAANDDAAAAALQLGGGGSAPVAESDAASAQTALPGVPAHLAALLDARLATFAAAAQGGADALIRTAVEGAEDALLQIYSTNPHHFNNAAIPGGVSSPEGAMHPADVAAALVPGPSATIAHQVLSMFCQISVSSPASTLRAGTAAAGLADTAAEQPSPLRGWETALFELLKRTPWLYRSLIAAAWKLTWVHGRELDSKQADALCSFALAAYLYAPHGFPIAQMAVSHLVDHFNATSGAWMHFALRWGCNIVCNYSLRCSNGTAAAPLPPRVAKITAWLVERYKYTRQPAGAPGTSALLNAAIPLLGSIVPFAQGAGADIRAWLMFELAVDGADDIMSPAARSAYLQTVLYSGAIPTSGLRSPLPPARGSQFSTSLTSSQPTQPSQLRAENGVTLDHWYRDMCDTLFETMVVASIEANGRLTSQAQIVMLLADLAARVSSDSSPWLVTYMMCRLDEFVVECVATSSFEADRISASDVYRSALEVVVQLPPALLVEEPPDADDISFGSRSAAASPDDEDGELAVPAGDSWAVESASGIVAALLRLAKQSCGHRYAGLNASAHAHADRGDANGGGSDSGSVDGAPAHVIQHALSVVALTAVRTSAPCAVAERIILDEHAFIVGLMASTTHIVGLSVPKLAPLYRKVAQWRQWCASVIEVHCSSIIMGQSGGSSSSTAMGAEAAKESGPEQHLAFGHFPPFEAEVLGAVLWDAMYMHCRSITGEGGSRLLSAMLGALSKTHDEAYRLDLASSFINRAINPIATWLAEETDACTSDALVAWVCSALRMVPNAIAVFNHSSRSLRPPTEKASSKPRKDAGNMYDSADGHAAETKTKLSVAQSRKACVFFRIVSCRLYQVAVAPADAVLLLTCAVHQLVILFLRADPVLVPGAVLGATTRVVLQLFYAAPLCDPVPAPASAVLEQIRSVNPQLASVMVERKRSGKDAAGPGPVASSAYPVALLPSASSRSDADLIIAALLHIVEN